MTTSDQPMDHMPHDADTGESPKKSDLERHITAKSTWIRLVFMILFAILYGISRLVTGAVVVIQFFHVLFTGETNEQLKTFGHSLAIYSFQIIDFLTFNTEARPFPLDANWPAGIADITAPAAADD